MKIILAIYLSQGKAVSHYKGELGQETVLSRDPLKSVQAFADEGISAVHFVDIDGSAANCEVAKKIAQKTSLRPSRNSAKQLTLRPSEAKGGVTLKISYAKDIATLDEIASLFENGVHYISLTQTSEQLVPEALKRFGPDRIFFTIRTQRHVIEGKPGLEVMDYGRNLAALGVTHIILRDMKAEGTFHPNFDEVERLVIGTGATCAKIFAFGGIGSMEDLEIMEKTGAAGVMISRAFFESKLRARKCVERFENNITSS